MIISKLSQFFYLKPYFVSFHGTHPFPQVTDGQLGLFYFYRVSHILMLMQLSQLVNVSLVSCFLFVLYITRPFVKKKTPSMVTSDCKVTPTSEERGLNRLNGRAELQ